MVLSLTSNKKSTAGIRDDAFPSCMNGLQATNYLPHVARGVCDSQTTWGYTSRSSRRREASRVNWFGLTNEDEVCCLTEEQMRHAKEQQHFDEHKQVAYWQHHFSCASPAATQPSVMFYSSPNCPGLLDCLFSAESFSIILFSKESFWGHSIQ